MKGHSGILYIGSSATSNGVQYRIVVCMIQDLCGKRRQE